MRRTGAILQCARALQAEQHVSNTRESKWEHEWRGSAYGGCCAPSGAATLELAALGDLDTAGHGWAVCIDFLLRVSDCFYGHEPGRRMKGCCTCHARGAVGGPRWACTATYPLGLAGSSAPLHVQAKYPRHTRRGGFVASVES